MIAERVSMSWMSPNMMMATTSNGGLGKTLVRMFAIAPVRAYLQSMPIFAVAGAIRPVIPTSDK